LRALTVSQSDRGYSKLFLKCGILKRQGFNLASHNLGDFLKPLDSFRQLGDLFLIHVLPGV
jgi:hypothetical protein